MVLPRASGLSGAFGRTILRRAGAQARARASRQIGRRTYASGHGHQQSSEIPWIIGSVAVTVPAAGWLWSQGPTKGGHGHGHDSHGDAHEEKAEEGGEEEPQEEDQPAEESKDEGDEKEAPKDDEDDGDKPSPDAPGQINKSSDSTKGPGEGQSGERKASEKKGEKDAVSDESGAKHPYIDDPEKSKKGAGPTETAKIHGTVDTSQPPR